MPVPHARFWEVVDPWCPVGRVCASCVVAGGGMAGAAGKSTVCIVLTDENTEDSNVRMNKVRCLRQQP